MYLSFFLISGHFLNQEKSQMATTKFLLFSIFITFVQRKSVGRNRTNVYFDLSFSILVCFLEIKLHEIGFRFSTLLCQERQENYNFCFAFSVYYTFVPRKRNHWNSVSFLLSQFCTKKKAIEFDCFFPIFFFLIFVYSSHREIQNNKVSFCFCKFSTQ